MQEHFMNVVNWMGIKLIDSRCSAPYLCWMDARVGMLALPVMVMPGCVSAANSAALP